MLQLHSHIKSQFDVDSPIVGANMSNFNPAAVRSATVRAVGMVRDARHAWAGHGLSGEMVQGLYPH